MPYDLFPKEIIDNTAEANFSKHTLHTKLIYVTVLLTIVAGLAALPFIQTTVSISSRGIIKPTSARNQVMSPIAGVIKKLTIKENEYIDRGQIIAVIASPLLSEKLRYNMHHQQEIEYYLKDLVLLQKMDAPSIFSTFDLVTAKYQRSLMMFKQQMRGISQQVKRTRQKFQRKKKLFDRKLISEASFEQITFELQNAQNKFKLLLKKQLNKWQANFISYRDELEQLKTNYQILIDKKEKYTIKAPISGTILNMTGIYEGGFVSPNQVLAVISPDTQLIAVCYLLPKDIGLIKEGMNVRFQISAYNFNQWGILTGEVKEIAKDITMVNTRPVFIVEASLDKTYLELQNGYKGGLKKGMTLQARFTVAKRSLFQLLFDNVDDWLNPQWDKAEQKVQQASL